jgi:hypothetical protein
MRHKAQLAFNEAISYRKQYQMQQRGNARLFFRLFFTEKLPENTLCSKRLTKLNLINVAQYWAQRQAY